MSLVDLVAVETHGKMFQEVLASRMLLGRWLKLHFPAAPFEACRVGLGNLSVPSVNKDLGPKSYETWLQLPSTRNVLETV